MFSPLFYFIMARALQTRAVKSPGISKPKSKRKYIPRLWKSTIRNLCNVVLHDKGFPAKDRFPINAAPPAWIKTPAEQAKFLDKVERTPARRGYERNWARANKKVHYNQIPPSYKYKK